MTAEKGPYHCIECGFPAVELYRDFNAGIIKIAHCVSTGFYTTRKKTIIYVRLLMYVFFIHKKMVQLVSCIIYCILFPGQMWERSRQIYRIWFDDYICGCITSQTTSLSPYSVQCRLSGKYYFMIYFILVIRTSIGCLYRYVYWNALIFSLILLL